MFEVATVFAPQHLPASQPASSIISLQAMYPRANNGVVGCSSSIHLIVSVWLIDRSIIYESRDPRVCVWYGMYVCYGALLPLHNPSYIHHPHTHTLSRANFFIISGGGRVLVIHHSPSLAALPRFLQCIRSWLDWTGFKRPVPHGVVTGWMFVVVL